MSFGLACIIGQHFLSTDTHEYRVTMIFLPANSTESPLPTQDNKGQMTDNAQTDTEALHAAAHQALAESGAGSVATWAALLALETHYTHHNRHAEAAALWEEVLHHIPPDPTCTLRHAALCCHRRLSFHRGLLGAECTEANERLWAVVHSSRDTPSNATLAARAITELHGRGASLVGADLAGVRIPGADLSGARLCGADLSNADLRGVRLHSADLTGCTLAGCDMQDADLGIPHPVTTAHSTAIDAVHAPAPLDSSSPTDSLQDSSPHRLLSAARDKHFHLWDTATMHAPNDASIPGDGVHALCSWITPADDVMLACVPRDGWKHRELVVTTIPAKAEPHAFKAHDDVIHSVTLISGPHGKPCLASTGGNFDKTVSIWDRDTLEPVAVLKGHRSAVTRACRVTGPNGESWLASAGGANDYESDKRIFIWDLASGENVTSFPGPSRYALCLCPITAADGSQWIATGSDDAIISVWNIHTGTLVRELRGHKDPISALHFTQDGLPGARLLVSGSHDGSVRLWQVETGKLLRSFECTKSSVRASCLLLGPNKGLWLAAGMDDGKIRIWDVSLESVMDGIESIQTKPDGNQSDDASIAEKQKEFSCKDVLIENVKNLSSYNKRVMFSHGAISHDRDFVEFCEAGIYTPYQANAMANCFAEGKGCEKSAEKALYWSQFILLRDAGDVEGLLLHAKSGSQAAFDILVELSTLKKASYNDYGTYVGEVLKYPTLPLVIAQCYENGWGVSEDFQEALARYTKLASISDLKRLAQANSDQAFFALQTLSEKKFVHRSRRSNVVTGYSWAHPEVFSVIGECFENGWGVKPNIHASMDHYRKGVDLPNLKRLAKNGSQEAFSLLKQAADEITQSHSRSMDTIFEWSTNPHAFTVVGECYENGWGVEKCDENALVYYEKSTGFGALKELCMNQSTLAFEALKLKAETKRTQMDMYGIFVETTYSHQEAATALGECYEKGWGCAVDEAKAKYWKVLVPMRMAENIDGLQKLLAEGSQEALTLLIELSEVRSGYHAKGGKFLCTHEPRHPAALTALARYYADGLYVRQDSLLAKYYTIVQDPPCNALFRGLADLAKQGLSLAREKLRNYSQVTGHGQDPIFPEAVAIHAELEGSL